ncbi:MAG: single-stranded DNA-binding protein [Candidatus Magasanikbacteria bacterium CG10_big_fil_rev_8_21_14_0_10_42_10]|uniref:Single-stranded DNA-binding protein n=2 Tax=Candidatus Magasanikiibacteriota TaxID=1752731 RepID=A0A2H0TVR1_9BACT|nr:MAG: single-stranded DNA-binding protein [Candidatus Magasanikbacteria bacterium CG10_big_fil_rev_8_21_14_0_10_42_10]PIZ93196.1 MAG: single-stranded DNA-binding protein [Candidatus Magasanikbacteria bacterium CG_4_10_14_0_2_um_filter_41_10]
MDLNRATILGRLTRDPEIRSTTSGKSVATLSVATNRVWSDQSGQKQEQAEFHTCVLWGKLADIAGQYLSKGRRVYVEGRIQTRDWAGNDGVKRYRTEIVADNLIMLDGARGTGAPSMGGNDDDSQPPIDDNDSADEIKVEDIPF